MEYWNVKRFSDVFPIHSIEHGGFSIAQQGMLQCCIAMLLRPESSSCWLLNMLEMSGDTERQVIQTNLFFFLILILPLNENRD